MVEPQRVINITVPGFIHDRIKKLRGDREMSLWEVLDEYLPCGTDNPFDCGEVEAPEEDGGSEVDDE